MTPDIIYQTFWNMLTLDWLEPEFMRRAFLAIIIISPLCAIMGIQMVNFRMAFFSDAISHSAFTGVALGILFNINPYWTMIIFCLLVGIGITKVKHLSEISVDTIIGIFFSASVALGIAIISAKKGLTRNLQSFLYGDILSISNSEILWFLGLFILIVAFMIFSYNKLILMGINGDIAKVNGINVSAYDYLYAILLSLTIAFSIKAIGILLITAMLIIPAASGRNIAKNVRDMFWYPVIFATLSGVLGLSISYYLDIAISAAIILSAVVFFIITLIIKTLKHA